MTLFNTFFIILGVAEFIKIFQNGVKKETVIYCICMVVVFIFAMFFFSNPFKPSFLSLILPTH